MSVIDTEALLKPISDDHPSGEDLEYDADFLAFVEASTSIPERRMGDSVIPAAEPDWRQVLTLGKTLMARSKDLRIAVPVTRALLQLHGLPGLHAGLELVQGLTGRFWDDLFPELDTDDSNDPTARVNVLTELADRDTLVAQLRITPLVRSRVFGPITWRDIEIAEGRVQAPVDAKPLDTAAIDGAFLDCDLDGLVTVGGAVEDALGTLRTLGRELAARVGAGQMPDFTPLTGLLTQINGMLKVHLETRQPTAVAEVAAAQAAGSPEGGPGLTLATVPGQISSRDDVVRTLEQICDYYSRYEPSSPVPLLLKRAKRLVTGSFVDILRDLAPDVIPEIERICGVQEKP
ncbi:MAG TPA: type VI secretion system protein TssA [Lamprocystis sp. (in: g-proteobacteria)]|nr:type VI secretion system protein TssA [Lamprocystis sp. (in: g-proteobacteria)]